VRLLTTPRVHLLRRFLRRFLRRLVRGFFSRRFNRLYRSRDVGVRHLPVMFVGYDRAVNLPTADKNQKTQLEAPQEGHVEIKENQKGVSFDKLFGPYLRGSSKIVVTDAYIRNFHQAKNLMDFLETVFKTMDEAGDMEVHLITCQDEFWTDQQEDFFTQMQKNCIRVGIKFTWEYDSTIHARHIVTDHGWKILLDRGLDVFQPFDSKDAFSLAARLHTERLCKKFEVTYLRV
jgi:ATP-dependent Lon protease